MLKGTRWLLMGSDTLTHCSGSLAVNSLWLSDRESLTRRKLNEPLATAYYLMRSACSGTSQAARLRALLDAWCRQAESSGIRVLHTMAKTLRTHRAGLLAVRLPALDRPAPEGTNNKIKRLQHWAYGYRNREHFR